MAEHGLGPNEDLVYCTDFLEKNIDWLQFKPEPLVKDHYFLFDFPGRLKLFTFHSNAKKIEEVYQDAVQELQGDHSRGTNMRHSDQRWITSGTDSLNNIMFSGNKIKICKTTQFHEGQRNETLRFLIRARYITQIRNTLLCRLN